MKKNPIEIGEYLDDECTNFKNIITAVSYEKRGLSSIESILEQLNVKKAILIDFGDTHLDAEMQKKRAEQKKRLTAIFAKHEVECINLECDLVMLSSSIDKIKSIVNNDVPNIINITTLPKNYIMRLAKEFDDERNIYVYSRCIYRELTFEELNTSIEKIMPIDGFEGIRELTAEDLLILILGYEGHRAFSFLSKFSPYKILPLISVPKEGDNRIDGEFYGHVVNCNFNLLRKQTVLKKSNNSFFVVPSLNHVHFFYELKSIMSAYKNPNIDVCISPLGTKAQVLGVYLYWREHPETQIVYSVPVKRFDITTPQRTHDTNGGCPIDHKKTDGVDNVWVYKLPSKVNL